MTPYAFETILFIVAASVVVSVVIAIGAYLNQYLIMRRINNMKLRPQASRVSNTPQK